MPSLTLFYCIVTVTFLAGAVLALKWKGQAAAARCIAFALPALAVVLAAAVLMELLESFFRPFNDGRLGSAASLLHGYKLYYRLDEGPILGLMYSPLAALMYLPATMASTPVAAVACGEFLTIAYYFGPVIVVIVGEARRGCVGRVVTSLVLVSFGLMTLALRTLSGPAFWIHADAPALGFTASACAWLHFQKHPARLVDALAPAFLAVAAVLSKQVAVPILAAVPVCTLILHGRRAFVQSLFAIGIAMLTSGAVIVSVFDSEAFMLNVIYIPAHHTWKGAPLDALKNGVTSLAEACLLPFWIVVACTLSTSGTNQQQDAGTTRPASRWRIWLVVAGLMTPTSVLGWVKIGADVNALAYTVYFLAVAAHLRLVHICSPHCEPQLHRKPQAAGEFAVLLLSVSLSLWIFPEVLSRLPSLIARFPENPERIGFEFAKRHPGEVYFPFNPLITLMSEGRAYHFSDGLWIRELAKVSASQKHIHSFVPERMRIIAYTQSDDHSRKYFPEFSKAISVDGLRGWNVFTVNGNTKSREGERP